MMSVIAPAAVNEALALLKAITDPDAAKTLLEKIAKSLAALDEREATVSAKEAELVSRISDVAKREQDAATYKASVDKSWAVLCADRDTFERQRAIFESERIKALAAIDARTAELDEKEKYELARGAKITQRSGVLDERETFLKARAIALDAREIDIAAGETALAERRARLTAALQA